MFRLTRLLLLLIATACVACSPVRPDPAPTLIECPKPVISPQLLQSPEHQAMDDLLTLLNELSTSVDGTPSSTPH